MFKSKKFTIAFVFMAAVICVLSGVLGYLVIGRTTKKPTPDVPTVPTKESTEQGSDEGNPGNGIRTITASDNRTCPVVNEDIPYQGNFTIVFAGEDNKGIVFHKKPETGEAKTEDVRQFGGKYEFSHKIYINDNGTPKMLLKTSSGYYVEPNEEYISIKRTHTTVPVDSGKIAVYKSEDASLMLQITEDDGVHIGFTLFYYSQHEEKPILVNVIGVYNEQGAVLFEYSTGTEVKQGKITFEKKSYDEFEATLTFDGITRIEGKKYSAVVFHTK